jgi:hypothetical protein
MHHEIAGKTLRLKPLQQESKWTKLH